MRLLMFVFSVATYAGYKASRKMKKKGKNTDEASSSSNATPTEEEEFVLHPIPFSGSNSAVTCQAKCMKARQLINEKKYEEATERLVEVISVDSRHVEANRLCAQLYWEAKKYQFAKQYLEVIRRHLLDEDLLLLAKCNHCLAHYEESLESLRKLEKKNLSEEHVLEVNKLIISNYLQLQEYGNVLNCIQKLTTEQAQLLQEEQKQAADGYVSSTETWFDNIEQQLPMSEKSGAVQSAYKRILLMQQHNIGQSLIEKMEKNMSAWNSEDNAPTMRWQQMKEVVSHIQQRYRQRGRRFFLKYRALKKACKLDKAMKKLEEEHNLQPNSVVNLNDMLDYSQKGDKSLRALLQYGRLGPNGTSVKSYVEFMTGVRQVSPYLLAAAAGKSAKKK